MNIPALIWEPLVQLYYVCFPAAWETRSDQAKSNLKTPDSPSLVTKVTEHLRRVGPPRVQKKDRQCKASPDDAASSHCKALKKQVAPAPQVVVDSKPL